MRRGKTRTLASMGDAARYTTPDGKFTLIIMPEHDLLGFEGYPWHTHGEFLPNVYRIGSVSEFLDALFGDRLVIAVTRSGDTVHDVLVTDDPESEKEWNKEGETLELRYWSGRSYHAG
jgi:hypothetical protein